MTHYPPGAKYIKHLDAYEGGSTRKLTCLCYFNKDWKSGDGGELRIFKEDGTTVDVAPLNNRAVIFQSRLLEHEVLEATSDRYALTLWFY